LRRGILYRVADELGATKIALGHHRDDILETFLLNLFYGAKIKAMPPKLVSDDGKHVVIRPLAYCEEADLARYAEVKQFPIIPCNLCGSQENLQRQVMKGLIQEWSRKKGWVENMFRAMSTVVPSHLMDATLFDFKNLTVHTAVDEGDIAFDAAVCAVPEPADGGNEGFVEQKIQFV
jgi:tRNA 2-thiocytidine biosynthesis protein TtcA